MNDNRDSPSKRNKHVAIFDLDGTLIDPLVGIANSYHHMCATLDLPLMTDDQIRHLVGPPIQESLAVQFQHDAGGLEMAVAVFRKYYSTQGIHEFSKYPGIDDLLVDLRDAGFDLCIATNKPAEFARQIVNESGWDGVFSIIGGSTLDGSTRHKRDIIAQVLNELADHQVAQVYVGDRPEDALGARPNGLPFIGVSWGFSSAESMMSAGAAKVASSAEQLVIAIRAMVID